MYTSNKKKNCFLTDQGIKLCEKVLLLFYSNTKNMYKI